MTKPEILPVATVQAVATQPPADLQLAWFTARPYDELAAWRTLYDTRYPAPAGYMGSDLDRRVA